MLFIFLLLINSASAESEKLQRLDPHGKKDLDLKTITSLKEYNQCSVCHVEARGKISLKPNGVESCVSCHNKSPHSGAADHIGKIHKGEKISCTSCHAVHRSEGKPWESPGALLKNSKDNSNNLNPMLKKTCSECHKW